MTEDGQIEQLICYLRVRPVSFWRRKKMRFRGFRYLALLCVLNQTRNSILYMGREILASRRFQHNGIRW